MALALARATKAPSLRSGKTELVTERPETQYAEAPDGVSLAYQVTGNGPPDLVWPAALAFPNDLLWDDPGFVHCARRLGRFSRTIWFEGRGWGASGGSPIHRSAEGVYEGDLTAVLDACAAERVALTGWSLPGRFFIRYADKHPERVAALLLVATHAHYVREHDYPVGLPPEAVEPRLRRIRENHGTGLSADVLAPSRAHDAVFRDWIGRCERLGMSPDQVGASTRLAYEQDVRHLLPGLTIPTLVLHRSGDRFLRVEAGRYLAGHIPGAKYVELAGEDHLYFAGDSDSLIDEIEEFLTGGHEGAEGDVLTTTIVFTDIVSSTEQAAKLGHRRWTALTDAHDAMVRATLWRHHGHEVKTVGDGFLVSFDATTRAVRAAKDIVKAARDMGLEVRAGVHTGEVEVRPDDVVGLPVSVARRICDLAGPGQVWVSEVVRFHITGSGILLADHGSHVLKGVPDEWRLYAVAD